MTNVIVVIGQGHPNKTKNTTRQRTSTTRHIKAKRASLAANPLQSNSYVLVI
jgi:hypothetical protein